MHSHHYLHMIIHLENKKKKKKKKALLKWPFIKETHKNQYCSYKLTVTTYRLQKEKVPFTQVKKN